MSANLRNRTEHKAAADGRLLALHDGAFDGLPPKLQWRLAGYYRAVGAFHHCAKVLDASERRAGESIQLLEERARLAFAEGNLPDARQHLERRIERAPSPSAHVALARFHLESGNLEEAKKLSDDLSRSNPDLATVSALAADVSRAVGQTEMARSYYLGVVDARPDNSSALFSLARLSVEDDDLEAAAAFLRRGLSTAGDTITAAQLQFAASIAGSLGKIDESEAFAERAAQIEQTRTDSLVDEISALFKDGIEPAGDSVSRNTAAQSRLAESRAAPPKLAVVEATSSEFHGELDPRVQQILVEQFGHKALRPGQALVISSTLR